MDFKEWVTSHRLEAYKKAKEYCPNGFTVEMNTTNFITSDTYELAILYDYEPINKTPGLMDEVYPREIYYQIEKEYHSIINSGVLKDDISFNIVPKNAVTDN